MTDWLPLDAAAKPRLKSNNKYYDSSCHRLLLQ